MANNPQPGPLETHLPFVHDAGTGGDVKGGGLRVPPGNVVVQGVNALKNGHLVLIQLQERPLTVVAHLTGKLKFWNEGPVPVGEAGERLV